MCMARRPHQPLTLTPSSCDSCKKRSNNNHTKQVVKPALCCNKKECYCLVSVIGSVNNSPVCES